MTSTTNDTQQSFLNDLARALQAFYLDCAARDLAPRTVDYYHEKLDPFGLWLSERGVTTARQLDAPHIRRYLVHLQGRDLSPYTVHAVARCVKTLCNFLVREGVLDTSPMRRVTMPKLPKDILPPFTSEDVRALLDVCEHERDRAVILLLLDSGVRAAECCALNIGDLDMATGALTVNRGKGRKSRVTFCGARARVALRRYLSTRPYAEAHDALFVSLRDGSTRLHYDGLRALLHRVSDRAGVADCDAHRFRRTFAIESLRAGMPIMQLSALMGHGSLPVLQRYLRLMADDLAVAHREHGPVDALLSTKRRRQT